MTVDATGPVGQRLTGGFSNERPDQKTASSSSTFRTFLDGGGGKLQPLGEQADKPPVQLPIMRPRVKLYDPNDDAGQHVIGCGQRFANKR